MTQKFHVIIAANASFACYTSRLKKKMKQGGLPKSEEKKIQNTQEIKRTLFDWTNFVSSNFRPILFHPMKKRSFDLLCVLDHLSD